MSCNNVYFVRHNKHDKHREISHAERLQQLFVQKRIRSCQDNYDDGVRERDIEQAREES